MLTFLRKYQKVFFIVIIVIIIVTFSFLGTQGITREMTKKVDKKVAVAYDGSNMKLSEIELMSYFLSTDYNESPQRGWPNLFNDGVIRNDFIRSGIAKILIEKYFDHFKESFLSKLEKIQKYKPFVHFNDSSISLATTLQMIEPQILILLKDLQEKKEINIDFFNCYIDLYNEQSKIQGDFLRRILIYQEKQNKIEPDLRLHQDNIALFGFASTLDWFGKDFIDLISQFILNTALVAKEKGYEVTTQEALTDLMSNLKKSLNDQMKGSAQDYYKKMLAYLGLDEKRVVGIWKNILLFRKYFKDVSNNTLIDGLAYKEFADFSRTKASIKLYKLPQSLQIKNVEDLVRFEMYLTATTNKSNLLDVPAHFKTIDEIEQNYPELVEKKYTVNVRHTDLENVALKVKTKDTFLWQLQDKNWEKLKNKFSFIKIAKTKEEKLNIVENLDLAQKEKIDSFSREEIVKENSQMINDSLLSEEENQYDFYYSKDTSLPIAINNLDKVFGLLDKQDRIEKYTEDNNNYFSFIVVERSAQKSLVTFEKALKNKIIDKVLDNYIQQYFQIDNEKEYDRVELAQVIFKDVFDNLRSLEIAQDKSLNSLAQSRFYLFLENAKEGIQKNKDYLETLNPQFKVECQDTEVSRSKNPNWLTKTAFAMKEKNYSPINLVDNGNLKFFYLDSFVQAEVLPEKIDIAKNAISCETSSLLSRKLIKNFIDKKCIVLPVRE